MDPKGFPFLTKQKFIIKPPTDANLDTVSFLRLLRNAIAHAHFSINFHSNKWLFWNIRKNGIRNFEVEIDHVDLGFFIKEVALYYINEVRNKGL